MVRPLGILLLCSSACSINLGSGSYASSLAPELAAKPARERVPEQGLRNIQRSLRLMSSSTASQRNHVRVLFYGQSITESAWSSEVARDLARRFPLAELEIENRALGAFPSNLLVKAAETDLYSFYPDLVIFHVYGAHDRYEDIVRRLHERTTAEIMLQTDHVLTHEDLIEQTDPQRLEPKPEIWNAYMNNAFLPKLAEQYQATLCDVRSAWKQHLRERAELPESLLRDGLHLNSRGDALMADYIESCLRAPPKLGESPAEAWIKTFQVGRDLSWIDGKLTVQFEGNRIDALVTAGASGHVSAKIDGRAPSEWPELYGFSRAHAEHAGKWPPLFDLSANAPLLVEQFTLEVTKVGNASAPEYNFKLRGSKTGADGSGNSLQRFESSSKRVVIDPEDWNVDYAFGLAGHAVPDQFTIELHVTHRFVDEYAGWLETGTATERVVTFAQGLPNTKHTLELTSDDTLARGNIRALRVYQPPLARF